MISELGIDISANIIGGKAVTGCWPAVRYMYHYKCGVGHITTGYLLAGNIIAGSRVVNADGANTCCGGLGTIGKTPGDIHSTLTRALVQDGASFTYPYRISMVYYLAIGPYAGYYLGECRRSKE